MGQKDNILDSFPYPMITTIRGEPNYETIRDLQRKLSANAASVPSNLGGGQHGYLALTVKPEVYFNLTGNIFTPPTDPGPMPNIVPGMDTAQAAMVEKQHKEAKRMFSEYTGMQNALKQLIVGAIENTYIRSLQHSIVGFLNVTPLIFFIDLYDTYGDITPSDLADNATRMAAPYDVTAPIETL